MTSSLERRSGPTTLLTTFSKPIGRRGIRFGDVAHRVGENGRGRGKRKLFLRNGVHRANAVVWGPVYLPAFVAAEQMPTAMDGSAIASSIKRNTPGRASARVHERVFVVLARGERAGEEPRRLRPTVLPEVPLRAKKVRRRVGQLKGAAIKR
eukprot:30720-Pelagococcus_subviridis.AAC.2